jgi:hypothetical protein
MESVPVIQAPVRARTRSTKRPTASELLARLDSQGITVTQYEALSIIICECGMVVTQRAFDAHTCIVDLSEREDN